jgi:DNA-binding Lrp family transcriptional regulator
MRKAFVLVNSELGSEAELQSEFKKIEGVVGVHQVFGVYDLVFEIEAESEEKLKHIVFSRIRALKHVRSSVTFITTS